jgi:acyl-CoA thioesterase
MELIAFGGLIIGVALLAMAFNIARRYCTR